jgi:hypothetical protein
VKDVVDFLTKLPNRAWPYGLVVVVAESGLTSGEASRIKLRDELHELMDALRRAGIRVYRWRTTG